MSEHVVLPEGCIVQHAHVMCYARTRAEYGNVIQHAKDQGIRVVEEATYVTWRDTEQGVDFMAMRPTAEQEEEFDYENLTARYRGRR